jgi:hypothetical protein
MIAAAVYLQSSAGPWTSNSCYLYAAYLYAMNTRRYLIYN